MAKGRREKKGRSRPHQGSKWERKDGRWGAELPVLGPDGATTYLTTTKADEEGADRWLNRMRYERDEGLLLSPGSKDLTLAAYLRRWLTESVEGTVARATLRDYRHQVENHILPSLGRKKLKDLTSQDLNRLYRRKAREGYSVRSVRYVHTTMHKALHEAEAWDLVRKNAARFASVPRSTSFGEGEEEREPMSPDEVKVFLRAVRGHRHEALYLLAVTTGMRRGELMGLKWSDLDLTGLRYRVVRSLDTSSSPPMEKTTKRKSSKRPGVLLPEVAAALTRHKAHQHADRLRAGPRWEKNGYVFPTRMGTPQRADNLLKRSLKPLCVAAGLRPLTFTDLRHSCATFLAMLGVHPKTAQRILGHSSIATTMNVYTHALDEMQEDAARKMRGFLFGDDGLAEGTP